MYAIRWHYGSTLVLIATLAACEEPSAKRVQKRAEQTVEATQDYAQDVQKDFEKHARKQLQELSDSIDQLSANAQNGADAALKERLRCLILSGTPCKLASIKMHSNSGDAWNSLRDGVDKAMTQLRTSYDEASKQMQK